MCELVGLVVQISGLYIVVIFFFQDKCFEYSYYYTEFGLVINFIRYYCINILYVLQYIKILKE